MSVDKEAAQLARVPMFGKLDPARLKLLAFTSRALTFAPGEVLVRVGEPSDSTYLILDGEAEVLGSAGDSEFLIDTVGENALIGEMGVLMSSSRTVTVRAKGEVRALKIAAPIFLRLLSENPEVALDVMRVLCERLADTTHMLESVRGQLARASGDARGGARKG
ncbi:MAG TPA: cyclic nucleotide-binding domain-containing protein [Casimicrobiaceae bacterium]|nr:cyclic nucleotide-binding domain-containing protein [Casimicrobiaceae bacterium]